MSGCWECGKPVDGAVCRVMASCGLTKHMTVHARWAVDSRAMEGRSD